MENIVANPFLQEFMVYDTRQWTDMAHRALHCGHPTSTVLFDSSHLLAILFSSSYSPNFSHLCSSPCLFWSWTSLHPRTFFHLLFIQQTDSSSPNVDVIHLRKLSLTPPPKLGVCFSHAISGSPPIIRRNIFYYNQLLPHQFLPLDCKLLEDRG